MSNFVTVMPAYGRDYKTAKAAKAAWKSGEDWQMTCTRQYISIREADALSITLRFCELRKVTSA